MATKTKGDTGVIQYSEIEANMRGAGLDYDTEIAVLSHGLRNSPPCVKINIDKMKKDHTFYLSHGKSYDDEGGGGIVQIGTELIAQLVAFQNIRAWFEKDTDTYPKCAAIDERPTTQDPVSPRCSECPHSPIGGKCKPKVRLLLLADVEGNGDFADHRSHSLVPCVLPLPPTSIKHWNAHRNMMRNTGNKRIMPNGIPLVMYPHKFTLLHAEHGSFTWGEVITGIVRANVNSVDMIKKLVDLKKSFDPVMSGVNGTDYDDPGDRGSADNDHPTPDDVK